ncbi:hypothetical protein JCM1840_004560 [Sporobolomyces johnsonii]
MRFPLRARLPLLLLASASFTPASLATASTRNYKARKMSTAPPAATEGFDLYNVRTPNGMKIVVVFEELINLGQPIKYTEHTLSFSNNEQKEPWFLEINPNGRIPAVVDRSRNDQKVWETGSILLYLSKHYDQKFLLHFDDDSQETDMWNWLFFQHGGYGPMAGQAGHFLNAAPEKIPYAAKRYIDESKRLLSVYEQRLASDGGRDYLVGAGRGKFGYADIASFPWVRAHPYSLGIVSLASEFPHVEAWLRRIEARPGTAKAIEDDMITKLKSRDGWEKETEEKVKWVFEAEGRKKDEL